MVKIHIPCLCNDNVVYRRMALAEAGETDPDDHRLCGACVVVE